MLASVGLIGAGCGAGDPSLDGQGRPRRNRTGETGGAAPDEPSDKPAGSVAPGTDAVDEPVDAR